MHSRTILSSVALACALAFTGWASSAAAQSSCSKNEECETGYHCVKGASSPGCDAGPDSECTPQDAVLDEVGYCEKAPVPCTNDEQCGEYLTCESSNSGVCWSGPDGEGCSEPDPDAPKYCGFTTASCTNDDDCPREFECVEQTYDVGCFDCEPTTVRACQPRTITCEESSECPSDWSCFFSSSGGGDCAGPAPLEPTLPDSGSGSSSDVPERPVDDGTLPPDCTPAPVETVGHCLPNELGEFISGSGSRGDAEVSEGAPGGASQPPTSKGPTNDANASSSSGESDSGGCSVAPALGASSGSWMTSLLWLTPLAFGMTRRRRTR